MNKLMLILLPVIVSCGAVNKHCGSDLRFACDFALGENNEELEKRQDYTEEKLSLIDKRFDLLEGLYDLNSGLIKLNSNAIADIIIPSLDSLYAQLDLINAKLNLPDADLQAIAQELEELQSAIADIEATVELNSTYSIIEDCSSSYFVLLKDNGSIDSVYYNTGEEVTELKNNKQYSYGNCNIRLDKSQGLLYYNSNSIDLLGV